MKARNRFLGAKMRIIFLPFLALAVITPAVYTLIRWLVDIRFHLLPLKEGIYDFWLPVVFVILLLLAFFRRRLLILDLAKGTTGHLLLAGLAIGVPVCIAQYYISKASWPLVTAAGPSAIAHSVYNRYYVLKEYAVDTSGMTYYYTATVSGKHNEHLDFACFLAIPVYDRESRADSAASVWYGIKYTSQADNRGSDAEKEAAYDRFVKETDSLWSRERFDSVAYFEHLPYDDDLEGYLKAIHESRPGDHPIVLVPQRTAFGKRTGQSFGWIFGSFGIGSLLFFLALLASPVDEQELDRYRHGRIAATDDLQDLLQFLIPHGDQFMTALLIDLNLIWFTAMVVGGIPVMSLQGDELLAWGAQTHDMVWHGGYWRLLSATFVHFGLVHLGYNMIGLALGGVMLEPFMGRGRFLLVYLLTGLAASWAGLYFQPEGVHAGASGAIFGLYGAMLGLTFTHAIPREERQGIWIVLALYAGISLVIGFFTPNVGNAAHLGGLVAGILLGLLFGRLGWLKDRQES